MSAIEKHLEFDPEATTKVERAAMLEVPRLSKENKWDHRKAILTLKMLNYRDQSTPEAPKARLSVHQAKDRKKSYKRDPTLVSSL